jgi:transcriptional regulator with XRE-family HTH domain
VSTTPSEPPNNHTGLALRTMRKGVGMTLRTMSERVGCCYQHLARIESGERALTPDLGWRIARAITEQINYRNRSAA